MRCDHCGFETDRPLKFCPRCGAGLAVPRNVPEKKKNLNTEKTTELAAHPAAGGGPDTFFNW